MQSVILAGGLGTRLQPFTQQVPKPMMPIHGTPYLEYQLRFLALQGIRDIVLLTGYLAEQIEDYFQEGTSLGVRIRYSLEPKPEGTGGALRRAEPLLEDRFLLLYGDSFLPIDYRDVLRRLTGTSARAVMVVYENSNGSVPVPKNARLDSDGYIERYAKASLVTKELSHVEAGVLALHRSVLDLLPRSGAASLENDLFPKLATSRELLGLPTSQRFYDIGTPERLEAAKPYFRTLKDKVFPPDAALASQAADRPTTRSTR